MNLSRYPSTLDPLKTELMSRSASRSSLRLHLPLYYNADKTDEALAEMQSARQSTLDVILESPQSSLANPAPSSVSILQSRASSARRADSEDSGMLNSSHYPFAYHDSPSHVQPSRQSSLNTSIMMPDSPKSILSAWRNKGGGYRKLPEPPTVVITDSSESRSSPSRSATLLSLSHFPFVHETPAGADAGSDARVNSPSPQVTAVSSPGGSNQNTGARIRKLPDIPQPRITDA